MDTDKIKINGKVTVTSPAELAAIEDAEHVSFLPDFILNVLTSIRPKWSPSATKSLNMGSTYSWTDNLPEQYLADHKVMVIEHADFDGIERIAGVTGTPISLFIVLCLHKYYRRWNCFYFWPPWAREAWWVQVNWRNYDWWGFNDSIFWWVIIAIKSSPSNFCYRSASRRGLYHCVARSYVPHVGWDWALTARRFMCIISGKQHLSFVCLFMLTLRRLCRNRRLYLAEAVLRW